MQLQVMSQLLTYNYLDPLTMVMPHIVTTQLLESVAQVTVTNADEIMRVRSRGLWANGRARLACYTRSETIRRNILDLKSVFLFVIIATVRPAAGYGPHLRRGLSSQR